MKYLFFVTIVAVSFILFNIPWWVVARIMLFSSRGLSEEKTAELKIMSRPWYMPIAVMSVLVKYNKGLYDGNLVPMARQEEATR